MDCEDCYLLWCYQTRKVWTLVDGELKKTFLCDLHAQCIGCGQGLGSILTRTEATQQFAFGIDTFLAKKLSDDTWLHYGCHIKCGVCKMCTHSDNVYYTSPGHAVDMHMLRHTHPTLGYDTPICIQCIGTCPQCDRVWICPENIRAMDAATMCVACVDQARRRDERSRKRRLLGDTIDACVTAVSPGICEDANGTMVRYPKRVWSEWMGAKVQSYLGPDGLYPDTDDDDTDGFPFVDPYVNAAWLDQMPTPPSADIRQWLEKK